MKRAVVIDNENSLSVLILHTAHVAPAVGIVVSGALTSVLPCRCAPRWHLFDGLFHRLTLRCTRTLPQLSGFLIDSSSPCGRAGELGR